nr:hypothetical protein [Tanacetum cinerariifolium]
MSTRSSTRNLFLPLDNLELTIRRRRHVDPTLFNDFEMATNRNGDDVPPLGGGDLPVFDLRTMEELCQPTLNGRGDDANKHLDKLLHVTQSIKVNGVTDDTLRLYLFPHSLTHHATAWFDRLPRNSITTFEQMAKMFLEKYIPPSMVTKLRNEITNFCQHHDKSLFEAWERYKLSIDRCPNHNMLPVTQIDTFYNGLTLRHRDTINAAAGETFMKRHPEECYDLIKNMTTHHNDWDTFVQRKINKNLMKVLQIYQQVKAVAHNYETYGGPHSYNDCPATVGQTQNVYAKGAYNQGGNSYQPQGNRNLLSYHSDNYLGPPGFNQNQNRNNQNQNYQNRNKNQRNNHGIPQGNNQGRNQFFQGASHGQNPPPAYQELAYQAPSYQALVHQASIPQPQVVCKNPNLRNLFPPLDNPDLTIQRRSRADPTLLNDFEMAAEKNGDLPVPDLLTIEELCQPSLNGRGGPIAPIAIQATNFGLKNDMIQQVQNSCQLHGLSGDDANKHLDKFLHVTKASK